MMTTSQLQLACAVHIAVGREITMTSHFLLYLFFLVLVGQLVGIKLCYGQSNNSSQNNIRVETPEIKGSSMLSDYIRQLGSTLHTRYKRDFESKEEFERHRQEAGPLHRRGCFLKLRT